MQAEIQRESFNSIVFLLVYNGSQYWGLDYVKDFGKKLKKSINTEINALFQK